MILLIAKANGEILNLIVDPSLGHELFEKLDKQKNNKSKEKLLREKLAGLIICTE